MRSPPSPRPPLRPAPAGRTSGPEAPRSTRASAHLSLRPPPRSASPWSTPEQGAEQWGPFWEPHPRRDSAHRTCRSFSAATAARLPRWPLEGGGWPRHRFRFRCAVCEGKRFSRQFGEGLYCPFPGVPGVSARSWSKYVPPLRKGLLARAQWEIAGAGAGRGAGAERGGGGGDGRGSFLSQRQELAACLFQDAPWAGYCLAGTPGTISGCRNLPKSRASPGRGPVSSPRSETATGHLLPENPLVCS